jgi:hypothetical protein
MSTEAPELRLMLNADLFPGYNKTLTHRVLGLLLADLLRDIIRAHCGR